MSKRKATTEATALPFREYRLPKIPPAYRNYEPRQAPTVSMFAADIRPQPPAVVSPLRSYEQGETGNWNSPEPAKRARCSRRVAK